MATTKSTVGYAILAALKHMCCVQCLSMLHTSGTPMPSAGTCCHYRSFDKLAPRKSGAQPFPVLRRSEWNPRPDLKPVRRPTMPVTVAAFRRHLDGLPRWIRNSQLGEPLCLGRSQLLTSVTQLRGSGSCAHYHPHSFNVLGPLKLRAQLFPPTRLATNFHESMAGPRAEIGAAETADE